MTASLKAAIVLASNEGREPALARIGLGRLADPERRALAAIAETADVIAPEGAGTWLLVPATPELLDVLAALGAEFEDVEPDDSDVEHDGRECELDGFGNPGLGCWKRIG